jgi:hypothetical protein
MLDMPAMKVQTLFDVEVSKDQKPASAAAKLADHLDKLEAQLRVKEKECIELREVVDACTRVLPQRTMAGRKATSMISLKLDKELTRESAEESDNFNDETSRVLPQRTMAGHKSASMTTFGVKSGSGIERQVCFELDKELTRKSAEESDDYFNDETGRLLLSPRKRAGRMAAAFRQRLSFRSAKGLTCDALLGDNETVESDNIA